MTVVSLRMAYRSFQEVMAGLTPASIRAPSTKRRRPDSASSRRKAFIRKWRLKHRAVSDSLEEAGDPLVLDPEHPLDLKAHTNAIQTSRRTQMQFDQI